MPNIAVIILTFNEELHIRRCIENVRPWVKEVFVVDSFSTDRTVEIAKELGVNVFQREWPGTQATQFNWALDNLPVSAKWVLRLDADEYLYPELIEEIKEKLPKLEEEVAGIIFKRRLQFLGCWIKRGTYPVKLLRLFKYGRGQSEQKLMDEHIVLSEGRTVEFDHDFVDDNLHDISWWTAKHNGYALREAVDMLDVEYGILGKSFINESPRMRDSAIFVPQGGTTNRLKMVESAMPEGGVDNVKAFSKGQELAAVSEKPALSDEPKDTEHCTLNTEYCSPQRGALDGQAAAKRAKKLKYAKLPLFWRAFVYFCYRYFLRGGFLEGREGFLWHFLQGWWYRTLVDVRIWEIKRESGGDPAKMLELLRGKYGMKI